MCLLSFISAPEKGILQLCSVLLFQSSWGKDDFKKQNKTMDFNIQQAKIWSGGMCFAFLSQAWYKHVLRSPMMATWAIM